MSSSITPTANLAWGGQSPDTTSDLSADALRRGSRVLGLRVEDLLERQDTWRIFLADDEERREFVLLVLAVSAEALASCLADAAAGAILTQTTFGSWHIAEVALDDSHVERWKGQLFASAQQPTSPTLPSHSASTDIQLPAGSTFAGRYQVEEILGRGGLGEVYRARDDTFQRAVALKVVRVNVEEITANRDEAKRRLLHEARVVSVLRHPHIVEIHDAGESAGLPYLALELCEGGNLRKAMAGDATQVERERWITEIAEALAHAHDRGIVHRDVKPENVVLTELRSAKVADFGIAKALRGDRMGDNSTLGVVGTPRYMAPEQLFGRRVDARADQFAWGLLACEVLTGSHPREGSLALLRSGDSVAVNPRLPAPWRQVLARAMASDPESRYPDFHAVLADLRRTPRERRLWPVLLAAFAALCSVGASLASSGATNHTAPAAQSVVAAAKPSFDAEKVDAEMVGRCTPEARPHFAAGLQLWRDSSQWEAVPKLDEATRLDPGCAPASLYYLIAAVHTYERRREQFRLAREQRGKLNDRERQLLEAVEPTVADMPNFEEFRRRAADVAKRMPLDVDARRLHVRALYRLERLEEALAEVDQTAALHSNFIPGNEFMGALIQIARSDSSAALERFSRCLQASPDSGDCLLWKGRLLAAQGKCREAESTLRHLTTVIPQSEPGHSNLANVLLVSTRDVAAARGVFEERWRRLSATSYGPDLTPALGRLADEYRMAIVGGDLEIALRLVRKWNEDVKASNNGRFRGDPLLELIQLLRELGYADEARTLARKGLREQRSWTSDDQLDVSIELARQAYLTGGIDAEEYRVFRSEWIPQRPNHTPADKWLAAFAGLPLVGADIVPPIASGEYASDWTVMSSENFARAATELVRLGRFDDALQHADAAAKCCTASSAMGFLHAQVAAARAHDAAGDTAVACKQYSALRNMLQKNPRSTTLHFATTRMNELTCRD